MNLGKVEAKWTPMGQIKPLYFIYILIHISRLFEVSDLSVGCFRHSHRDASFWDDIQSYSNSCINIEHRPR